MSKLMTLYILFDSLNKGIVSFEDKFLYPEMLIKKKAPQYMLN